MNADDPFIATLLPLLEETSGRRLYNSWPTELSVSWATNHGDLYPASTSPLHASVGPSAMARFLRPIAYQEFPVQILPTELRDQGFPTMIRRTDGTL